MGVMIGMTSRGSSIRQVDATTCGIASSWDSCERLGLREALQQTGKRSTDRDSSRTLRLSLFFSPPWARDPRRPCRVSLALFKRGSAPTGTLVRVGTRPASADAHRGLRERGSTGASCGHAVSLRRPGGRFLLLRAARACRSTQARTCFVRRVRAESGQCPRPLWGLTRECLLPVGSGGETGSSAAAKQPARPGYPRPDARSNRF